MTNGMTEYTVKEAQTKQRNKIKINPTIYTPFNVFSPSTTIS